MTVQDLHASTCQRPPQSSLAVQMGQDLDPQLLEKPIVNGIVEGNDELAVHLLDHNADVTCAHGSVPRPPSRMPAAAHPAGCRWFASRPPRSQAPQWFGRPRAKGLERWCRLTISRAAFVMRMKWLATAVSTTATPEMSRMKTTAFFSAMRSSMRCMMSWARRLSTMPTTGSIRMPSQRAVIGVLMSVKRTALAGDDLGRAPRVGVDHQGPFHLHDPAERGEDGGDLAIHQAAFVDIFRPEDISKPLKRTLPR